MKAPLTIATILKPQGIRGEIKVRALTDSAENLKAFKTVYIDGAEYSVFSVRAQGDIGYLALKGIADRNAAELLRGKEITANREEAKKDYKMMSGIPQDVEPPDSVWSQTKARLPWRIIALFGGMVSAYMISCYEAEIALFPVTAMFIPVITAMGGNVGIQSSAIVVQGLASNSLGLKHGMQNILKELGAALLNATICSSIIFVLTLFFKLKTLAMPITVTLSLFVVILFASIFGTAFPLLLHKMKIDPALATGPFITLTNDIIGLNIYLITGRIILEYF